MTKTLVQPQLENLGSLITYKDGEHDRALGYLMDFTGHGVYDAAYGKVDVSSEHVKAHNEALDNAMLEGLDTNCKIGQGGSFYLIRGQVTTFMGTVVSESVSVSDKGTITFYRKAKIYRGRTQKDADVFNFKRIS